MIIIIFVFFALCQDNFKNDINTENSKKAESGEVSETTPESTIKLYCDDSNLPNFTNNIYITVVLDVLDNYAKDNSNGTIVILPKDVERLRIRLNATYTDIEDTTVLDTIKKDIINICGDM